MARKWKHRCTLITQMHADRARAAAGSRRGSSACIRVNLRFHFLAPLAVATVLRGGLAVCTPKPVQKPSHLVSKSISYPCRFPSSKKFKISVVTRYLHSLTYLGSDMTTTGICRTKFIFKGVNLLQRKPTLADALDAAHDLDKPALCIRVLLLPKEESSLPFVENVGSGFNHSVSYQGHFPRLRNCFQRNTPAYPARLLRCRRQRLPLFDDRRGKEVLRYNEQVGYGQTPEVVVQEKKIGDRVPAEASDHRWIRSVHPLGTEVLPLALQLIILAWQTPQKKSAAGLLLPYCRFFVFPQFWQ